MASGPYSCDADAQLPDGVDPRYMSYANFLDGMVPTSQSPYKPYAALQNSDFVGWGLMGNVQLDLSDAAKITWISSYRQYQSNFSQDQDGSPVPIAQLDNQLNAKAWSQELRLGGDLGHGFFDYTIGGFYMKQNNRYTARVDLNYAGIDFVHGPDLTPSTSKALFFNGTIHPTEAWSVTGGVRRSWDQKTYTYFRSNPDGTRAVPRRALHRRPALPPICESFFGANPTRGLGPTAIGNSPNCLLTGLYGVQGSSRASGGTGAPSPTTASRPSSWPMPRSRPATWAAASTRGRSSALRPASAMRPAMSRRRRATRSSRSSRRRLRPTKWASSPTCSIAACA